MDVGLASMLTCGSSEQLALAKDLGCWDFLSWESSLSKKTMFRLDSLRVSASE